MSDLKITVCGVGNAGMAIAADVSMMGFEVNVFEVPEFSSNLDPIKEKQGIQLTGNTVSKKTGLAKLNVITDNAKEAVDGVDLIMVSVPAPAHENVLKQIIPHLQEGQTVLFNTGYWSSIRFNHLLEEAGILN